MQTVQLDKKRHNRKAFDCEVDALNDYLHSMANQHSLKDNTRTYILENSENPSDIVGYYTLTMTTIELSKLPPNLQKKHFNNHSSALIARLAVDKKYKHKKIGSWLLIDALKRVLNASDIVAFPMVIVDAKDGIAEFYEKFGFFLFLNEENKLYLPIATIRANFGS
jgi:GNAT superfamily N-acetyltransferase